MSYTDTSFLGLKKADKGSNQAFETDVFNANWDAVDDAVLLAQNTADNASSENVEQNDFLNEHELRLNDISVDGWVTTARIADANVTVAKLPSVLDLTGKTVTVASPSADAQVATKKYVDDRTLNVAAWASYSPTKGGGLAGVFEVSSAVYTQVGKTVFVRVVLSCTNGSGASGLTVTLPVASKSPFIELSGVARSTFPVFGSVATSDGVSTVTLKVLNTASTYGSAVGITGSIPGTWVEDEILAFTAVYEAA
jgi:hypothetical protein